MEDEWCELRNIPASLSPEDLRTFFCEAIAKGLFVHFSHLHREQDHFDRLIASTDSVLGQRGAGSQAILTAAVACLVPGGMQRLAVQVKGAPWRTALGTHVPGPRVQIVPLGRDASGAPALTIGGETRPAAALKEVTATAQGLTAGYIGTPLSVLRAESSRRRLSAELLRLCGVTRGELAQPGGVKRGSRKSSPPPLEQGLLAGDDEASDAAFQPPTLPAAAQHVHSASHVPGNAARAGRQPAPHQAHPQTPMRASPSSTPFSHTAGAVGPRPASPASSVELDSQLGDHPGKALSVGHASFYDEAQESDEEALGGLLDYGSWEAGTEGGGSPPPPSPTPSQPTPAPAAPTHLTSPPQAAPRAARAPLLPSPRQGEAAPLHRPLSAARPSGLPSASPPSSRRKSAKRGRTPRAVREQATAPSTVPYRRAFPGMLGGAGGGGMAPPPAGGAYVEGAPPPPMQRTQVSHHTVAAGTHHTDYWMEGGCSPAALSAALATLSSMRNHVDAGMVLARVLGALTSTDAPVDMQRMVSDAVAEACIAGPARMDSVPGARWPVPRPSPMPPRMPADFRSTLHVKKARR